MDMPLSSSLWTRSLSAFRALASLSFIYGSVISCVQTEQRRDVGVSRRGLASHLQTSYDTSGSSLSELLGDTPVTGNLLVAVASSDDNGTISTPSGYSVAVSSLSQAPYQVVYYKEVTNPSSDRSIDISVGGGHWHLQFMEFSGVDPRQAPTVATAKRSSTTAGGTFTFNSVTTTAPGAMVLTTVAHKASSLDAEYASWTNSFTETGDGSYGNGGHGSAYYNAATAGTYTTTVTVDRAGSILGHTLVFYKDPNPATDLAVSAGVNKNTLTFVPPELPVTHALILAKTTDCNFSGTPTGTETKGTTVGTTSTVIFNDSITANLASTNVTVSSVTTTVTYTASTGALVHGSLTAGTLYCYKVFVRNNTTLDDNTSPGRPTRSGTPTTSAATHPTFVLSTGTTALAATSILPGSGAYYSDNAGKILSSGSDGVRLFEPYQLSDAVQSRGPVGTLTGDSESTLFLSSLDGDAYAIWASGASKGSVRWSTAGIDGNSGVASDQALATDLVAAPVVSKSLTRAFIATRNSSAENRLFSVNAQTGACQWVFNGDCSGGTTALKVGYVSSAPVIDPTNYRLVFTSSQYNTGSTVWALDPRDTPSGSRVLWQKDYGAATASPAFTDISRSAIVVGTTAGRIYKLDPSTGLSCWGATTDGCGSATGGDSFFCTNSSINARATSCASGSAVQKGIVATADPYAGYFLVTTADGNVRLIDSTTGAQVWRVTIAGASAPLLVQGIGSGYVYVGSNTGTVYELALTTGTQTATRSVGGGSVVVGDPAYDGTNQKLYVSTSGGNLYAFSVPF